MVDFDLLNACVRMVVGNGSNVVTSSSSMFICSRNGLMVRSCEYRLWWVI